MINKIPDSCMQCQYNKNNICSLSDIDLLKYKKIFPNATFNCSLKTHETNKNNKRAKK